MRSCLSTADSSILPRCWRVSASTRRLISVNCLSYHLSLTVYFALLYYQAYVVHEIITALVTFEQGLCVLYLLCRGTEDCLLQSLEYFFRVRHGQVNNKFLYIILTTLSHLK